MEFWIPAKAGITVAMGNGWLISGGRSRLGLTDFED